MAIATNGSASRMAPILSDILHSRQFIEELTREGVRVIAQEGSKVTLENPTNGKTARVDLSKSEKTTDRALGNLLSGSRRSRRQRVDYTRLDEALKQSVGPGGLFPPGVEELQKLGYNPGTVSTRARNLGILFPPRVYRKNAEGIAELYLEGKSATEAFELQKTVDRRKLSKESIRKLYLYFDMRIGKISREEYLKGRDLVGTEEESKGKASTTTPKPTETKRRPRRSSSKNHEGQGTKKETNANGEVMVLLQLTRKALDENKPEAASFLLGEMENLLRK